MGTTVQQREAFVIVYKHNDTFWKIAVNIPSHTAKEFEAEFCDAGDIKISVWRFYRHKISDEDLALFYRYSREELSWIPLICNGRLL